MYFVPVTELNGVTVVGNAAYVSSVASLANPQVRAAGMRGIKLLWDWPADIQLARVVYRTDRVPEGPDDPLATLAGGGHIDRKRYEREGGLLMDRPPAGVVYHFLMAAAAGENGQMDYATGITYRYPLAEIRYILKKSGIFGKKYHLEITCREPIELPEMALVSRARNRPAKPGDGNAIKTYRPGEPGHPPKILNGTWKEKDPFPGQDGMFAGLFALDPAAGGGFTIEPDNECRLF